MRIAQWSLNVAACAALVAIAGCASTPDTRPQTVSAADKVFWSVDHPQRMLVNVSPAGRTMRLGGTIGTVVGIGVDAAVNSNYREKLDAALGGYDPAAEFDAKLEERLNAAVPAELEQVPPLQSSTQYRNMREAADARYENLGRRDADQVLDLELEYGVFGTEGIVVAKIDGELNLLPDGKKGWGQDIVVAPNPILANMPLGDPSSAGLLPNLANPRFKADEDAISQWTENGGAKLREAFEVSIDGAISALLCSLGIAEEATGEYYLGKLALINKEFDAAYDHFERTLALDPTSIDARNGQAVALALNEQLEQGVARTEELVEAHPDYAPGWYNLAWWYATELGEAEKAAAAYKRALELGMQPNEEIDKALEDAA